jgi:hypothetical protein
MTTALATAAGVPTPADAATAMLYMGMANAIGWHFANLVIPVEVASLLAMCVD